MRLAVERMGGELAPVEISRGGWVLRVTARRQGWRMIAGADAIAAVARIRPESVTVELPGRDPERVEVRDPAGDAVRAMFGAGLAVWIACSGIAWAARRCGRGRCPGRQVRR